MNDFNIQAASLISGVSVHQIRAWERRYNAVSPKRLDNNFRSYTQEDITRLKLLGMLTKNGIAISKIASLDVAELQYQNELLTPQENPRLELHKSSEDKVKLDFLLSFFNVKKMDILKYEVTKFETLNSITEILIPLIKRIILQSDFKNDDNQILLVTLIEQINKISTQASHKSAS